MIGRFKKNHGIAKLEKLKWMRYREVTDKQGKVIEVEDVAAVGNIESWDRCEVPLSVVLIRARNADGQSTLWALASTKEYGNPRFALELYKDRTKIEEEIDQIKNCWWMECFTTPNFNADAVHVFFVLLVYTLVELYLKATHHEELATRTIETLTREERLGKDAVIVYAERYFGVFDLDECFEIILDLNAHPRKNLFLVLYEFAFKCVPALSLRRSPRHTASMPASAPRCRLGLHLECELVLARRCYHLCHSLIFLSEPI